MNSELTEDEVAKLAVIVLHILELRTSNRSVEYGTAKFLTLHVLELTKNDDAIYKYREPIASAAWKMYTERN